MKGTSPPEAEPPPRHSAKKSQYWVDRALNRIVGIYAKAPANGLKGLIGILVKEMQATAVALVVEFPDRRHRVEHSEPSSGSSRESLQTVLDNEEIKRRVCCFAQGQEDYIRFECSSNEASPAKWHEALFIRLPRLGFSQNSSSAFICIVDRLVGRTPGTDITIQSARTLVTVVTSLFRRLEAHILRLEQLSAGTEQEIDAQPAPHAGGQMIAADSIRDIEVDSGLGIDDESVVEEWAPWMQLAHVARLHRALVKGDPEREKVCRSKLEQGWPAGLPLRKAIGIDQDVQSGEAALKAVLDWTQFIDRDTEWFARERENEGYETNLRCLLLEVAKAARLELDPTDHMADRSLGCHLLASIAAWPQERTDYWLSSAPSDDELKCAFSSIARLVHHAIGNVPMDPKTIQAYIWVLSEYAHKVLGLPAQFDIRAHLGLAEREEPALHGLKRFYRNHFFHALEVCLLGHFLLAMEVGDEPLWKRVARLLPACGGTSQGVLRLWYLTALLHDIGYAVDIAKGTVDLFQMFGKDDIYGVIASGFKKTIEKASEKMAEEQFQGYSVEDAPGEDHGIVGARHIKALLDRISREDTKFAAKDYDAVVRAIALHNCRKYDIHFEQDPLASLLVLCDTLQEWKRPAVPFSVFGSEVGAWLLAPDSPHPRPSEPFRTARLSGISRSDQGEVYGIEVGGTLKFELIFGEHITRNWGVYSLWLSCSYNLQRLDLAGLGFNIDVKLVTPSLKVSSMRWLRDAARETHMAFLDRWFPNQPGESGTFTNGFLTHRPGSPWETLTLHLNSLAQAKPLTRDTAAFRDAMKRWRHRDFGWDFDGDYAYPESLH